MNDKTTGQSVALRQFCFAGLATAERPTFYEQFGSSGAMNRAINSATAEKCCVRRVYYGGHIKRRDVAAGKVDLVGGRLHFRARAVR
jgi:hypothetical protein